MHACPGRRAGWATVDGDRQGRVVVLGRRAFSSPVSHHSPVSLSPGQASRQAGGWDRSGVSGGTFDRFSGGYSIPGVARGGERLLTWLYGMGYASKRLAL